MTSSGIQGIIPLCADHCRGHVAGRRPIERRAVRVVCCHVITTLESQRQWWCSTATHRRTAQSEVPGISTAWYPELWLPDCEMKRSRMRHTNRTRTLTHTHAHTHTHTLRCSPTQFHTVLIQMPWYPLSRSASKKRQAAVQKLVTVLKPSPPPSPRREVVLLFPMPAFVPHARGDCLLRATLFSSVPVQCQHFFDF